MKTNTLDFDAQALREKILDLAMRGKLVPQDPNDEPASVLLEKIKAEKEELIKEKKIKKSKPLAPITEDEKPFDLPDSWKWVRLGDISKRITDGTHNPPPNSGIGKQVISAVNIKNGEIDFSLSNRFVTDEQFLEEDKRTHIRKGDILLTIVGSLGNAAIVKTNDRFTAQRSVAILNSSINSEYFYFAIISNNFKNQILNNAKGTTQKGIYLKKLANLVIAMPPLAEQSRIAAKIAQLFALLRKVESSIQQYAKLKVLLKSKVLDLATRGELVEQDPHDEPASVLLEKIKAEKEELIKEKKIKRSKPLAPITEDEKPFDLPASWEWVRCKSISTMENFRNVNAKEIKHGENIIELADIESYTGKLIKHEIVHEPVGSNKYRYKKGNILFAKLRPYLRKVLIAPNDGVCTTELLPVDGIQLDNNFLYYIFLSNLFYSQIEKEMHGVNLPRISPKKLSEIIIPLPPLSEQGRIVAKIAQLSELLD